MDNVFENDQPVVPVNGLGLLQIDSLTLGVFEEQVMAVNEWSEPTPLPFSPDAVLGIVCVEGRMFTVLEISGLLGTAAIGTRRPFIVALRGEEQFALAVDSWETPLKVSSSDIETIEESSSRLICRVVKLGDQQIPLLETSELFSEVIQGRERRRRRF
jgi:chemotaxis signal transduction protein